MPASDTLEASPRPGSLEKQLEACLAPGQNPKQRQEVLRLPPRVSSTVQEPRSNVVP